MSLRAIPSRLAATLHFARRVSAAQFGARLRLRMRRRRLASRGLDHALPRSRVALAPDWRARVGAWGGPAGGEAAPWQELPGRRFHGSPEWLAAGPRTGGRYASELYRLELFYHEFLVHRPPAASDLAAWLPAYLETHRSRVADGGSEWNVYAASNRLANWLAFLAGGAAGLPVSFVERMAGECLVLADFIDWLQEKDILANHWLKNLWAIALCDWLLSPERGRGEASGRNYLAELEHQILPDGAHFELCPMYHAKMMADLARFRRLPGLPADLERRAGVVFDRAARWLRLMTLVPGQWANFSDSWQIPGLAEELPVWPDLEPAEEGVESSPASGFVRLQSRAGWRVLLDAGGVGPEFNPAHSHADVLSVIAAHRGSVLLQDPGVLHYSPNDERAWLKSARAHNGPCLADRDHTEIVGSFRIGRAARGRVAALSVPGEAPAAAAAHAGYPGLALERRVVLGGEAMAIHDEWKPGEANTPFRPWVRWLLRVRHQQVSGVEAAGGGVRLAFESEDGVPFVFQATASGGRPLRWCVGESFVSEEFGRTRAAVEVVVTGEKAAGVVGLVTRLVPRL